MMMSYIWPVVLVVVSNTVYQICAKSVPETVNPFASLIITYLVAAASCTVLYFVLNRGGSLMQEFSRVNWSSFLLGLVIVGLEAGMIYAYKAGWAVNTLSVVASAFLAVALIVVGFLLFREKLTWTKLVGVAICLVGLVFINK